MNEYDLVALVKDIPEHNLKQDDIGTIVHIYPNNVAYEVDFVSMKGDPVALVTLTAQQIEPITKQAYIRKLVNHLTDSNYVVAQEAIQPLLRLQEMEPFLATLASPKVNRFVLKQAVLAIYQHLQDDAVEPLLYLLEKRGYIYEAIVILRDIGDVRAVPVLGKMAHTDEAPGIVTVLGRMGHSEAVPWLLPLLRHKNPLMRYYTIRALGMLRDEQALPILEEAQANDTFVFETPHGLRGKRITDAAKKAIEKIKNQQQIC